ncbi:fibronectin [Bacillus mycoides]|nr:fibronectin [Bacillus mycoides]
MVYLQYTKKRRLTPTDIHLPPKIGVSHLHIFGEGVFCQKTIKKL